MAVEEDEEERLIALLWLEFRDELEDDVVDREYALHFFFIPAPLTPETPFVLLPPDDLGERCWWYVPELELFIF